MTFTKTPPTEPGLYYWRKNDKCLWEIIDNRKGQWIPTGGLWGGRVPEPGATFTVEEFLDYVESRKNKDFETKYPEAIGEYNEALTSLMQDVDDLEHGIAAVTERNKKC